MKLGNSVGLLTGVLLVMVWGVASAQVVLPAHPKKFVKRNLGDQGGGISLSGASTGTAAPKTVVVQYVAVTPVESWKNQEGKTMEATLLAFSAPAPGTQGAVEVIREGKVRFLVAGKKEPTLYPLDQLGEAERERILEIAEAAKNAVVSPTSSDESEVSGN